MDREEISNYLSMSEDVNVARRLEKIALDTVSTVMTKLDKIYVTPSLREVRYENDRIKEKVEIVASVTSKLNKHLLLVRDKFAQEIDSSLVIQVADNILDLFYWIRMDFHTMDDIERRINQGLSHTYNELELIEDAEEEIRETGDAERAKILRVVLEVLKATLSADKALMNIIHMSIRATGELAIRKIDSVIKD
ncbi:hypothetical protein DB313_04755 (plasmid) [Borrelia turcica IST7]|uniref:Uncharacterized protein n=1 Tax=Borrelia turcica IST7 TaxID=1104446 RepID=A0A386PND8_9SPIR|nr:hypothetical protein [Borrelia turcica]AYE36812.1 hypothetical protein DB313_04755 [Borrelia turcica IST7]